MKHQGNALSGPEETEPSWEELQMAKCYFWLPSLAVIDSPRGVHHLDIRQEYHGGGGP